VADPSLSVLLSQVLLAYTIELDNEFELQMSKTYARPFLTSIVMLSNFLRYVRDDGTTVDEIALRSCAQVKDVASVVGGMERWGYATVDHADPGLAPMRKGFGSGSGVKRATMIRPSMVGRLALEKWSPLPVEIERRWRERLGAGQVDDLKRALREIDRRSDDALPHFLPIVGGLMFAEVVPTGEPKESDDEVPALLARALLALTLEVERGAPVSLPLCANVLRVLDATGAPVKDLPRMTGVSKEAVATSLTNLQKLGLVDVGPLHGGRWKAATITSAGEDARVELAQRIDDAERAWEGRFGADAVGALRSSLRAILDRPGGEDGALSAGLVTPPGGWRATKRYKSLTDAFVEDPCAGLPHHPMVLHRGGWPDGS
jgi:hypothetical protein